MKFSIGQHVSHPSYGPGEIMDIEEKILKDTPRKYYVVRVIGQELITYVPVDGIDKVGLRAIISKKQTENILLALQDEAQSLPKDYKQRQSWLKNLIFSGRPIKIAQAIRELTWSKFHKGKLNASDKKLLEQGKEMLVAEVALARDTEKISALSLINDALWSSMDENQKPTVA